MNDWLFRVLAYILSVFINGENIEFPCETPDGEHAYCVSLFSCPHLIKSLSTLDSEAVDYVKRSICLGCEVGEFMVCCGSPKYFSENTDITQETVASVPPEVDEVENDAEEARRKNAITKLLPSQRICGQQHTDDRFYDRNETALDEFPWIVHLEGFDSGYDFKCSGVLINNRYVLTANSCGQHAQIVRLGQHSTQKNVTCVEESPLFLECTEPVVRRGAEKKIVSGDFWFNLMLLRLNESVMFSEYIRPICLPIDGSERPTSENYLTFSGFGADDGNEVLKKRIPYNLTNSQVCHDADTDLRGKYRYTTIGTLACLVPPPETTFKVCNGDKGSPLMYRHKYKWFADAFIVELAGVLVNEENGHCSATAPISGLFITPDVMEWILDNIEN